MLTFDNTAQVIPDLRELLMLKGDPFIASSGNSTGTKQKCVEIRGGAFTITNWDDRNKMMEDNKLSVSFAEFDIMDRLSPRPINPGKAVELDTAGVLSKHLRDDGTLDYTYSERMWYQLEPIVELLKEEPATRQAFISIWDPSLDIPRLELSRVPCSIGFQFLMRNGKLNLVYYMRSLEVTVCLGNDIYTSTRLLEEVAKRVGTTPGTVTFLVGSMHIFY